ncbi:TPA: hypothetical protein NG558_004299 [Vibrio parahaemolyticus]|uniref:hypothetical protein n=1 Tax=Vibrio parahaemolyticus TaxID=670 RepID=UPI003297DEC5|nr:hypothetical protein [Vibrio parahaemolyticus]
MNPKHKKIEKYLIKSVRINNSFETVTDKVSRIEKSTIYSKYTIGHINGIVIFSGDEKFFYFENANKMSTLTKFQKKLNERCCPPPFYLVGKGDFKSRYYAIRTDEDFNKLIFSIFTAEKMATIYNQIICESELLSPHKSTIFESMEAYWLGMDYISTDSLMSVMEGALRDLIFKSKSESANLKFQGHIRSLAIDRVSDNFNKLKGFYWYPFKSKDFQNALEQGGTDEELKLWVLLDHSMDAIHAFLSWFSEVLYKNYSANEDTFTLNRHNFFHAFSKRDAIPVYYPLMLWSLLSLVYMESLFIRSRDPFFPETTKNDEELGMYLSFLAERVGQSRRKVAKIHGVTYD